MGIFMHVLMTFNKGCEWAVPAANWWERCSHHKDGNNSSWEWERDSATERRSNQVCNLWPVIPVKFTKKELLTHFASSLQCRRSTLLCAEDLRGIEAEAQHDRSWQTKPEPEDDCRDRWPQQNQGQPRRAAHRAYKVRPVSITAVGRCLLPQA